MYSLLRRRNMMIKPSVIPTERLIYQLYDYTCDGTINTFIDTGIKLFGYEYDSFRIEMEYDNLDLTQVGLATLLECKSFINSNFTPGLAVKVSVGTLPGRTDAIATNIYPCIEDNYFQNTSSATVILTYDSKSRTASIDVNGSTKTGSGMIMHNEPLTIGGRYSSHLSNPDRFVQVHISSLKIYATPSGIDTSYIYLPLTFKCLTEGDLSIKNTNTSYDRNFEYSLNGGAWTEFDLPKNTASKLIATLSPNDTISFRRDNDNFADAQFLNDSNLTFDIYGNLLSLQYGSAFSGQTELRNTTKKAFGEIFSGTNVIDASKLMLTAPILSSNCYYKMFRGCTSLVSAPIIFATELKSYSLNGMFSGCYNLVNVQSQLYVTTLSVCCCKEMFDNCQSLINAPALPATTLVESCYYTMFRRCYSLTVAPELPATTMAKNCYYGMFSECTGLVTAPNSLPATTLAEECCRSMFYGCTSLTTAPKLLATTLAKGCYQTMFYGCTSLTAAPDLLAPQLIDFCYNEMFRGCRNLSYIKCTAINWNYNSSISSWLNMVSANGTFVKATGVTWNSGPSGIPNSWNEAVEIEYLESSGTQYIDIGVIPNMDDIVEIEFATKNNNSGTYSFFGYMASSSQITPRFGCGTYSIGIFCGVNGTINLAPVDNNKHSLRMHAISDYINDITFDTVYNSENVSYSQYSPAVNETCYLFARHGENGIQVSDGAGTKIWKFSQFTKDNVCRIDLVPVRVGSVGYMLDLVSKQLFGNYGTGDFILGPDKTY